MKRPLTSAPLMASTAWPTAGTARRQSVGPARPGPPHPARRLTADAVALPEGDDDALVVWAQDEVEREAERLLGVGAGRVVVQLVDEAARLVHHVDAEDRHGARRPDPEVASRRAPETAPRARGFPTPRARRFLSRPTSWGSSRRRSMVSGAPLDGGARGGGRTRRVAGAAP